MRRLAPLLLSALSIALPLAVIAGDAPPAPPGPELLPLAGESDGTGAFALATDGTATRATARGDGARLVARRTALVIASDGTRLRFATGGGDPIGISPEEGAFRLLAGAGGARIDLGRFSLDLARAEVLLAGSGASWSVGVVRLAEGGSATLHDGRPPEPAPENDGEPVGEDAAAAPDPEPLPSPPPRALAAGDSLSFAGDGVPEPTPPALRVLLETAGRNLPALPPAPAAAGLQPVPVEDPADFASASAGAGIGGAEIEIEAVEVEVGCVEVCVD